jgi:hypothetical protein
VPPCVSALIGFHILSVLSCFGKRCLDWIHQNLRCPAATIKWILRCRESYCSQKTDLLQSFLLWIRCRNRCRLSSATFFPSGMNFAQTTQGFASDLFTAITPRQLEGQPECCKCGCVASAGLASTGRFKLANLVKVGDIFGLSRRIGEIRNSRNRLKQLSEKTPVVWLPREHFDLTGK